MLKLILPVLMTIVAPTLFAQSKTSEEIIADGAAKMKVKPDVATFTLTLAKSDTVEKNAIRNLNKTAEELASSLESLGFTTESIKIGSYEVSSFTDREQNKVYTATNVLKVNLRVDNKLINSFYVEMEQSGMEDLDVNFATSLSDSLEKASRQRLVQQAIVDAKLNATNIAQALNVRIIKVKQVQKYGIRNDVPQVEMVKFTPPVINYKMDVKQNTPFNKFEVEETELEEKLTVIYEIAN